MKKAVYHGIRDIRIEEVPEPRPGPKEVKIKVKYCGICGSDLHEYLHGLFPREPFWARSLRRNRGRRLRRIGI